MMNRVILVGRITKDPELKSTSSGIYFVQFTVAVNRPFAQDNENAQKADFVSCVVWRRQAENLAKYVKKGALIGVEGRISTRSYETESGTRYVTEVAADSVQFLESRGDREQQDSHTSDADNDDFYETSKKLAAEDDLPF